MSITVINTQQKVVVRERIKTATDAKTTSGEGARPDFQGHSLLKPPLMKILVLLT